MKGNQLLRKSSQIIKVKNINSNYRGFIRTDFICRYVLWAFWDPYKQLDDLPVAVVNLDKGQYLMGNQLRSEKGSLII